MVNLKTKFIGLELKSPIIAGSCGLTSEVSKIEEIALSGAGAIVLKSIFEEQINMDASKALTDIVILKVPIISRTIFGLILSSNISIW